MRLLTALLLVSLPPRANAADAGHVADAILTRSGALASGDVDGDGVGDLAVGGSLFLGPLATTAAPAFTVTGSIGAVAVGDVDDDGLGDLLLGAPYVNQWGAAYLFHGPLTGESNVTDADATFDSTRALRHAGASVSIIADHTGDGVADLLVGAPAYDKRAGSVYVVSGALTGSRDLVSASTYVYKDEEGHNVSYVSVAAIGDQNGDGIEDLLIGAAAERRAYVVEGGGPDGRADLEDIAVAELDGPGGLGTEVAAGDLDGDGYSDAVVSAPGPVAASHYGGVVYGFTGPFSGAIGVIDAAARWEGEADTYGHFGVSVAAGSDADGDGSTDVLIGDTYDDVNGRSAVFLGLGPASGVTRAANMTAFRSPDEDRLGTDVSFVPDTSGDGLPEIAGSAPGAGVTYLFLSDSLFE